MAQNESFNRLAEKARGAESLGDLFCLWKQAHEAEPDWKATCTLGDREEAKSNFVYDGRFGSAQKGGILFICKESNVGKDTTFGEKEFWLKKVVETKSDNINAYYPANADTTARRIQSKFFNCLDKIAKKLNCDLPHCAYMNLNKRGGASKASNAKIEAYAKKYEAFILKEIELLKCDKIVLFSANQLPTVRDALSTKACPQIITINCHPSWYSNREIDNFVAK